MSNTVFVLGGGQAIVTQGDIGMTMAVKLDEGYCKFRKMDIGMRSEVMARLASFFRETDWFSVGTGPSELLINKGRFFESVAHIRRQGRDVCQFVLERLGLIDGSAVSEGAVDKALPAGRGEKVSVIRPFYFQGVLSEWTGRGYKITVEMIPSKYLSIVGSKKIYESAQKIHKKTVVLWTAAPDGADLIGRRFVVTKSGSAGNDALWRDFFISRDLTRCRAPNVISLQIIQRAKIQKVGLICEYCWGGTLQRYIDGHCDEDGVLDRGRYLEEHLRLAFELCEGLATMQVLGFVHGDIRMENILIRYTDAGPQPVIVDFGLTSTSGTAVLSMPGTFPPPEAMELFEAEEQQDACVPEKVFIMTHAVDSWAFGLMLYVLAHGCTDSLRFMAYDCTRSAVLETHSRMLTSLAPMGMDAIDDLIRRLLALSPTMREPMECAFATLGSLCS